MGCNEILGYKFGRLRIVLSLLISFCLQSMLYSGAMAEDLCKDSVMPCQWREIELFWGPENAGKLIHPSLDIAQFEALGSLSLTPAQFHSLAAQPLSLTRYSSTFASESACFENAEIQATEALVKAAQGSSMKRIQELMGPPADRTGPDAFWGDDSITEYWFYYLGYSKRAVLLGFKNDVCAKTRILTKDEATDAWRRRLKLMMSFGMPEKEFLHLAGPPKAVSKDQYGRTIYQYSLGDFSRIRGAVNIPVKDGKVCQWRGIQCLFGWGASCEQFY